ncbi:di-trans,poly-cis-decaprenylcistransferase [Candidatus Microgenomates bacterium]|nr:di-trans,poly-cis-decaprenylcistransferase [Candidatus Microgenomates bacterium]
MKLRLRQKKDSRSTSFPKDAVLPNHVALICDGNRRWARAHSLPVFKGHDKGFRQVMEIAKACRKYGIHTFTAWLFSTENWDRDKKEIDWIMKLGEHMLSKYLPEMEKEGVRFIHLGRKDQLPERIAERIAEAEERTRHNTKYIFNLAFDYGGRDEITRAMRKIAHDKVKPEEVTENLITSYLDTSGQPYPYVDLLIRTSAEQRFSGLLPWQMSYAEIWWEEEMLPAFGREKFIEILADYSRRRRRFGGDDNAVKFNFKPLVLARLDIKWRRAMKYESEQEFREAAQAYLREQFGISVQIAKDAAEMFARALILGESEGDWKGTKRILTRFYSLIKSNVKLAFEPQVVAQLEIDYLKGSNGDKAKKVELHEILTRLLAETFRIPLLQAQKAAHFRVLAQNAEEMASEISASSQQKKNYTKKAEEYLVRSYEALKERIA